MNVSFDTIKFRLSLQPREKKYQEGEKNKSKLSNSDPFLPRHSALGWAALPGKVFVFVPPAWSTQHFPSTHSQKE